MKGTMTTDLRGTELNELKRGDRVNVIETTNLPRYSEFKYFVSPVDGSWGEGSLAVYASDVKIDKQ